jgi:hypothetical protein
MRSYWTLVFILISFGGAAGTFAQKETIPNPAIDMKGYLTAAAGAAKYRETRRLTENEFITASSEKDVVVLDARSREKFDELHIKGAINLSFSDMTVASLQQLLPDKTVKILIYCNNNFKNVEQPFPTKIPAASLNLSTYIALYTYGYRNIYELGPLLDVKTSKIEFEGNVKDKLLNIATIKTSLK